MRLYEYRCGLHPSHRDHSQYGDFFKIPHPSAALLSPSLNSARKLNLELKERKWEFRSWIKVVATLLKLHNKLPSSDPWEIMKL
ncbi:hypothetical protein CUMW_224330 [Citrus unshiu]|uniref:Uncharacterized protein n=1 Tax=Citrus unshiu TaxID=55188 RepID=A0A2H5QF77_CITUN|nr:hypothetical protein CUMW_224330 [Citrus unshiu]